MPFLTHFIGITSSIRAQYGIDLPGNFLVAASQHGGTSAAEGSPYHMDRIGFVLVTFHGGSFLVNFLKNEILGFDANLAVVLLKMLIQLRSAAHRNYG